MRVFRRIKLQSLEKGFDSPKDFIISELNSGKSIAQISVNLGISKSNLGIWADRNGIPRYHAVSIDKKIKELGYDSECEYFIKNWYRSFASMADELDSTFLTICDRYTKFRGEMLELRKENSGGLFCD